MNIENINLKDLIPLYVITFEDGTIEEHCIFDFDAVNGMMAVATEKRNIADGKKRNLHRISVLKEMVGNINGANMKDVNMEEIMLVETLTTLKEINKEIEGGNLSW